MQAGAITSYFDVAQVTLYGFWIFFAGLVIYLHRENKREGYPLESDMSPYRVVEGFPPTPKPKSYLMHDGSHVMVPRVEAPETIAARPAASFPGAPLQPTGNPMLDGVGAAAYAERSNDPDLMFQVGLPKIVPMRVANDYSIAAEDRDPRGMNVIAADGVVAGVVRDCWVDRSETIIRYLEVEVQAPTGPRRVLVPMTLCTLGHGRRMVVESVTAAQFADAPATAHPEQISLREEDRISAYFASGHLYAGPLRLGPIL